MLSPRKLREAVAFSQCRCQPSSANVEKLRDLLGAVLGELEDSLHREAKLLPVKGLELSREGESLEANTYEATRLRNEALLGVIREGRSR